MVPLPPFPHLACEQSLTTSALELKYARSTHLIDIITQEESTRRLRFDLHILEDDNDELRDLLSREEERSDSFERYVHSNLIRAEEAEARLQDVEMDLRTREQELTTMRAEKEALQYNTVDLTAAVTEKLAMTRELSVLRPELEHLKTQAANAEVLMAEKLALQRQISEVQCEVENAKREARRALAKRRNTGVEIAQEEQMDELRRQLKKAERARVRAEEAADVTQADLSIDEVRKELAREKRGRQKAEQALEEAQQNSQIEDVRKDLLKEKKAKQKVEDALEALKGEVEKERKVAARADRNAASDEQAEELRQALAKEKKARVSAERSVKLAAEEYGSQKAVLEDKLGQFRIKLRSSKTEIKEKDAELEALKAELAAAGETKGAAKKAATAATKAPAKNAKKRNATQLEVDATTLGTPGDGPAAKRSRKAAATVVGGGDKSTFSVTPFLNRTMSVAPEGSADDDEEKSENEYADASPKPPAKKAATTKQQPLAVQSVNVPTKKAPAQQRKQKVGTKLAMVTEESEDVHSQGQENANKPATMKIKTKISDGPDDETSTGAAAKNKKKIRKSIHDFAAFTAAVNDDDQPIIKQKKRKLGGLGKTLFDEEEEMAPKALPGRGLFGVKGANMNFGGLKKGGMGSSSFVTGGAKSRLGSTFMTAGDGSGFVFSPLKRARKGLDDTLRG
ncbi:hypothetical protein LTR17_024135 [Elasticomyces elasticus]|nr:hypothetical protein LTR17_024135 [Elasticomyces elasticus]